MSDIVRALRDVIPAEAVEDGGPVETGVGGATPEAVVSPASVAEIQDVLAAATRMGFGVVPVGGATALGPEAPVGRFVVLRTGGFSGVEDYEPADLTVTVRAGTVMASLGEKLAAEGQWVPADPPFLPAKTVGGFVAGGMAGPLGMAYGAPRDHVLGLTVVTGDGRVLRLGGRVMKNVAGFDLVKLMVGGRGTLGVVTSASLRLFPLPEVDRVLVLKATSPGGLLEAAHAVATAAVVPASAVLVSPAPGGSGGPVRGDAALVVRIHGAAAAVDADARTLLGSALTKASVLDDHEAAEALAAVRDGAAGYPIVLRIFALPALLPQLLDAVHEAVPEAVLTAEVLSGRMRAGVDVGRAALPQDLLKLRGRVEALGGTVILERAPAELLDLVPPRGPSGRGGALGQALRGRFDPAGVLSPGRFAT